jgi:hypothetical protein
LSQELRAATEGPSRYTARDGSEFVMQPPQPSATTITEAQHVLPSYEAAMAAPERSTILQWLRGVAVACRPSPDPAEVEAQATWMARFSDLPGIAYTRETLAHVGNHAPRGFFPAPAQIRDLVMPLVAEQVDRLHALRRVAAMPQTARNPASSKIRDLVAPLVERAAPTDEEREYVSRVSAELRAELEESAKRQERCAQPLKPGHVSDDVLLAQYEKEAAAGGPNADSMAYRAKTLRSKKACGRQDPSKMDEDFQDGGGR